MAKDKSVRDAFRRFMAQHPDRYDYGAAKIPSALTEDMEKERKAKMAEKKKALKKAKKQREKVKATDESVCIESGITDDNDCRSGSQKRS